MTIEINTDNIQDLIIQGTKEAIDLEVQRLRDEGQPILTWQDEQVVDTNPTTLSQGIGCYLLLAAYASFVVSFSICFYIITGADWNPEAIPFLAAMFFWIASFCMSGFGVWLGDKKTRRICLFFIVFIILPLLAIFLSMLFSAHH